MNKDEITLIIVITDQGIEADALFWQLLGKTATRILRRRVAVYITMTNHPNESLERLAKRLGIHHSAVDVIRKSMHAVKRAFKGGTVTTHNAGLWHIPPVTGQREERFEHTQEDE